jgi:branched-chain amino acid aminotransferase
MAPAAPRLPQGVISVDGVITSVADARISPMDHGFLFGDSVYEVVRTLGRRPVALREHMERLRASADLTGLVLPWTDEQIAARMRDAVAATDFPECYVRLVVTRGAGPMSLLPDGCDAPSAIVYVLPLRTPSPEDLARGATVVVPARLRNDARALTPAAKTGNYLNNLLALTDAKRAGADDAVMLNAHGHVTEATTANVLWVRGGRLFTPALPVGILAGITRRMLLAALRTEGTEVEEGSYPYDDLATADEAMLTGTVRGVHAVTKLDGVPVGSGLPGPVTLRLMKLYDDLLVRHTQDW